MSTEAKGVGEWEGRITSQMESWLKTSPNPGKMKAEISYSHFKGTLEELSRKIN